MQNGKMPVHRQTCREVSADTADGGFVLVVVLAFLALFAVIVLMLSGAIRYDVQARANLLHAARAEALADGLATLVAAQLVEQMAGVSAKPLRPSGNAYRCRLGNMLVEAVVIDATGLVDLNAAPVELLERLIAGVGAPQNKARALAAAIGDYRDADDVPRPFGAETSDYLAAGLNHGPKNAPFETVEELDQVLGMNRNIFLALRDLVTVHSQSPMLDIGFAPPELVVALAGMGSNVAHSGEEVAKARATLQTEFASAGGARSSNQVIMVGVETPSKARFRRRSVIALNAPTSLGFQQLEWSPATSRYMTGMIGASCRF